MGTRDTTDRYHDELACPATIGRALSKSARSDAVVRKPVLPACTRTVDYISRGRSRSEDGRVVLAQHSLLFGAVQRVDRGLITLNLGFLVPVTLLPFVTQLMGARQDEWAVALAFALINLVAVFLFRQMRRHIEQRPDFHKSTATLALAERIGQGTRLFFATMILGVLVALYNAKAGIVLFLIVPFVYFYNYVRDSLGSDSWPPAACSRASRARCDAPLGSTEARSCRGRIRDPSVPSRRGTPLRALTGVVGIGATVAGMSS